MEVDRVELKKLLDILEESGDRFIGPNVHGDVVKCKYPSAWIDTLRRYTHLLSSDSATNRLLYVQFYLDLCVTILTKRIMAIDIHRMVGADDDEQSPLLSDTRIIHAITFNMSISRMLACICECVLKCSPVADSVTNEQTTKLYQSLESMLKNKFYKNPQNGNYYAREKIDIAQCIHDIVDTWLLHEALPNVLNAAKQSKDIIGGLMKTRVLANDLSFFGVSHCYWLWLHLTTAGIQTMKTESDFLAMFYAFDLFIFCEHCSSHFVRHRPVFYTRDPHTASVHTTYTSPDIVFRMHNIVNRETSKDILSADILSDYRGYWERDNLLAAGN
jgi:hypothetical protein